MKKKHKNYANLSVTALPDPEPVTYVPINFLKKTAKTTQRKLYKSGGLVCSASDRLVVVNQQVC